MQSKNELKKIKQEKLSKALRENLKKRKQVLKVAGQKAGKKNFN